METSVEPSFAPWREIPFTRLVERVSALARERSDTLPHTIAVDGRSGAGKSTFAAELVRALTRAAVVHTDDVAWHHSFFDWQHVLLEQVLEPARAGRALRWRPDPWIARGREGAIEVPTGTRWLIIEGVGAARRELAHCIDASVWMASDPRVARERELDRDGRDADTVAFIEEWGDAERRFIEAQRPWGRTDLVVCGTPDRAVATGRVLAAWPSSADGERR